MLRLVLDTNVVLDLVHWGNAEAAPILAALEGGRIACLADEGTLEELHRVLAGAQLGLAPDAAGARFRRYRALVCTLPPGEAPPLPRCKDGDDQKFLALAARAHADLLVSRDNALLRLRGRTRLAFTIVAPAAAVALLPPATAAGARSLPS